ncbi:hypothetical protein AX17_003680 [Amanita inopinata Kibby_2008]|nr:hypothetical protein AX17_003680 [Amanita inopinata Kibby_2008]
MYDRYAEVQAFLGAKSERFAGYVPTGLGVVEAKTGRAAAGGGKEGRVEREMRRSSVEGVRGLGADVLVLGCAGMAGMEEMVRGYVREAGLRPVRVVDGAKAGVEILAGLVRLIKVDVVGEGVEGDD